MSKIKTDAKMSGAIKQDAVPLNDNSVAKEHFYTKKDVFLVILLNHFHRIIIVYVILFIGQEY